MGHDSDHPRSLGEVGREGVAIDTVDDMETLFGGIPLGDVTVSMTINAPGGDHARVLRGRGRAPGRARHERSAGTIQTDILKEYIAQKEWCFPVDPAMRLVTDMVEWCSTADAALAPDQHQRLPHPRGGGDRRTGAGVHAQGRPDLRRARGRARARRRRLRARGCRSSSTPRSTSSRRSPSTARRGGSGRGSCATRSARATSASWLMRFHTQTAGVSLTAQQPLNNIVRTAIEALAGVLGGTQSLHTNSYDEALALPTEEAVRIALRTQQIIASRDRRDQHDRSARRRLLRRVADRPPGGARLRVLRQDRRARRDGRGGQGRLPAARDRRRGVRAADARSTPGGGSSSASTATPRATRRDDRSAADRSGARAQADRPGPGDPRRPRHDRASSGCWPRSSRPAPASAT